MMIAQQYQAVRQYTLDFCSHLEIEDYSIQVAQFASPAKWHLAHTTWFFETFILKAYKKGHQVFDTDFNYLFNSYYNNVGKRVLQANRGNISRPSTDKVLEYRRYIDQHMLDFLSNLDDQNNTHQNIINLVILGLNHEQQHQELLVTDVKYMLGNNPIFPIFHQEYDFVSKFDADQTLETINFDAGIYQIGHQGDGFCYDNELGSHKVYVEPFAINSQLATNAEYLEFITDGGYQDFNLWLDDGWTWVNSEKITAPLYWHKIDNEWHYYTLAGLKKLKLEAPLCHINQYEANAFSTWKKMRLPTEFEWEIASQKLNWGKRWEWTSSAYLPYPNFAKADGAVGEYNGKFMSNKMVLRGASVATPQGHSRNTYRNFFHPSERWQYTGLRLAV